MHIKIKTRVSTILILSQGLVQSIQTLDLNALFNQPKPSISAPCSMSVRRDLDQARLAYQNNDPEKSREAHSILRCGEAGHSSSSEGTVKKCAWFGGFEGILFSSVVLPMLSILDVPSHKVFILSSCGLVALAVAFALRDFIRYRAEYRHYYRERDREKWELENYPEGEMEEMIELYMAKGMSAEDAKLVVSVMSKYEEFFIDVMMCQELRMQLFDGELHHIALSTLCAVLGFGFLPILGFALWTWLSVGISLSLALVIVLVTSALLIANNKLLPQWNRLSTNLLAIGTVLLTGLVSFVVTRWGTGLGLSEWT